MADSNEIIQQSQRIRAEARSACNWAAEVCATSEWILSEQASRWRPLRVNVGGEVDLANADDLAVSLRS